MSEAEEPEVPSMEELLSANLMQQMRIYDVLIHLLAHFSEESADKVMTLHEGFGLYGPMPFPVVEE
jgi:hypothetical protein